MAANLGNAREIDGEIRLVPDRLYFKQRNRRQMDWHVVLVVDVTERNTIVVNDISMGLAADAAANGRVRRLSGYAGLDVSETNLAGTGITLGGAMAFASNQLALRVRFLDPAFLGSNWMVGGSLLYNDAEDFFGTSRVIWNNPDQRTQYDSAVVDYTRFGGSLGVGRDLSVSTQVWLHYRLESLNASYPYEASQSRGFAREPIDFDIIRGRSVLSTLRGTLQVDTRDHPFLPTRGSFSTITTEVGLLPAGRDYDYARVDVQTSRWFKLPWREHVLRLSAFAGAISGNAPFFEQYYVGDFSDFLPDRVLGVTFDHRYPKNFLGTQIVEVRYGKYALDANADHVEALGAFGLLGELGRESVGVHHAASCACLAACQRAASRSASHARHTRRRCCFPRRIRWAMRVFSGVHACPFAQCVAGSLP